MTKFWERFSDKKTRKQFPQKSLNGFNLCIGVAQGEIAQAAYESCIISVFKSFLL